MSKNGQKNFICAVNRSLQTSYPSARRKSPHGRAYRDSFEALVAVHRTQRKCEMAKIQLSDSLLTSLQDFLDHIEADRSNAAATRNCRRAALRSFIKHLLRNDLAHSLQYTQILAIPFKKAARGRDLSRTGRCPRYHRQAGRETPTVARLHFTLVHYNCGARSRSDRCSMERPPSDRTRKFAPRQGQEGRFFQSLAWRRRRFTHLRGLGAPAITSTSSPTTAPATDPRWVAYILSKYTRGAKDRPQLASKKGDTSVLRHKCGSRFCNRRGRHSHTRLPRSCWRRHHWAIHRYNLQMKREAWTSFGPSGIEPAEANPGSPS